MEFTQSCEKKSHEEHIEYESHLVPLFLYFLYSVISNIDCKCSKSVSCVICPML